MKRGIAYVTATICILLLHVPFCFGESTDTSQAVNQLNNRLYPLPSCSPLLYEDDLLAPLDRLLSRAAVVGLGEATHGAREFFEVKHRMFKYLVEHHGFKALGYEVNFGLSLQIDRYITRGEGDIDSLLSSFCWIQANGEVLSLVRWMREYNIDKPEAEKIRFIGLDSQLDIWNIDRFEQLIREFYPLVAEELEEPIETIRGYGKTDYKALSKEEYEHTKTLLAGIRAVIQRTSGRSDREAFLIASRLADGLIRSHEFLYDVYQGLDNPRDKDLAYQALWIGEFLGEGIPYALWAHNAHVGRNPSYDTYGNGSMGRFLADRLGSEYVVIATSFARGSFTAVQADSLGNDTPPLTCTVDEISGEESVHGLLDKAEEGRYFLLLDRMEEDSPLYSYLNRDLPMLGVGDFYLGEPDTHASNRMTNCLVFFDVIFFLNDTHPLRLLPRDI